MSDYRQADKDVIEQGRNRPLKDVEVELREQINDKLYNKLVELEEGKRTAQIWDAANVARSEWLDRYEKLMQEYDEFLEPIYTAPQSWSSTLHLPVALTVVKTYHARMLAALLGVDPPFTMKARQAANQERAILIQELMRYTLSSWCNYNQGIEEQADAWLWHWITAGCGILKARWDRTYTRYVDVVKRTIPGDPIFTKDQEGNDVVVRPPKEIEEEQEVTKETFNGPLLEHVMPEDVVFVGGKGDPQLADDVIQQSYLTASQLWTLSDSKVFKKDAVEAVINAGRNYVTGEPVNSLKIERAAAAGTGSPDKQFERDRYQILERYAKIDVDGSGIASDVILWVHKETHQILRATYLYRVNSEGQRPYFKIDFHKRFDQDYGIGLPELIYSLTKEIDAIHNMKVDFGLISSMPFGFYRATSNMSTDKIPFEPGALLPLDNPQTDVFFPQLGNRTGFTGMEEQSLQQAIDRFTSISDISLGVVGGQGATRTATGTRALLGESNANLDVYLRRMNRGWKRALIYLFQMLQNKIPKGFQFRVLGDDGSMYWETVQDPKALQGMYDFELESNSANSNKSMQVEQANSILQAILNPLLLQTGTVTPANIYNALKYKFQVEGVRDFGKFIQKPMQGMNVFSPEELANRILAGVNVPLTPEQDLQGFVAYVEHIFTHDELLGQFGPDQAVALAKKMQEAQGMIQALQAQQAQVANASQQQINAGMAQNPQPVPQGVSDAQAKGQQGN